MRPDSKKHKGRWRGKVNPVKTGATDPTILTKIGEDKARDLGTNLVGVAGASKAFVYRGQPVSHKHIASLGTEMDYGRIAATPSPESTIEVARVHCYLGETTIRPAEYTRN